ncbi:MAG TPA: hypothetical protein VGG33_13250 [Polyangia bacterium]
MSLGPDSRSAPAEVLRRPSPSPEEILNTLAIKPRTYNSLRRYVTGRSISGTWNFGRLLQIPGFGARALEDVLLALGAKNGGDPSGESAAHRHLDDELDEVLSARPRRRPQLDTPLLRRSLGLIGSRLPASEQQILRRLQSAGLSRGTVDLGQVERAARFIDGPLAFVVLRRDGLTLAVQPERQRLAALIYALAVRSVVSFGLALLRRIAFLARTEDFTFVRAVVTAKDSFEWLDPRVGWFWFGNTHSQLVRTIENILSVAGPVPLRELAHVLFRRWAPDNAPSARTLRALCDRVPALDFSGGEIRLRDPQKPPALPDREQIVLRVFRECGSQIEGHELPEICHRLGLHAGPLGRQLRASPFVIEPRPGVFRLIGS